MLKRSLAAVVTLVFGFLTAAVLVAQGAMP